MSPGYQQSWEPKEGSPISAAVLPAMIQIHDALWVDFDADFTLPAFLSDAPTAPNRGLRRRPAMRLLRVSSLPTSVQVDPRMTESEWQEIDKRLEDLYDFRRDEELYAPPLARSSPAVPEQQPKIGIVRCQTAPVASKTASPRMVLEDDGEAYLPQMRARLRKRDILKSFGANLATKFKKLGRAETYTGRPPSD